MEQVKEEDNFIFEFHPTELIISKYKLKIIELARIHRIKRGEKLYINENKL